MTQQTTAQPRTSGPTVPRRVSRRIGGIAESATLAVDARAKALKAAGRPVIGFGAGEPDFPTPDYIVEAAIAACSVPANHRYTPAAGLPDLRAAVAAKTERDSGYRVAPEQVLVTNGGKQAVYQAFATLLDPGDEVLLPAPYWTTYPEAIRLAGGVPVEVFAGERPGLPRHRGAARVGADPADEGAAVLLPVEPDRCGVLARAGRAPMGEWALEHGIWVITDEIYEHLVVRRRAGRPIVARGAGARGHTRGPQRRREDLRHDRLAGGLDDRPEGRRQGRDEPAVAPDVERRQRRPARGDRRPHRRPVRRAHDARGLRPPASHHRRHAQPHRRRGLPRPQGAFYAYPSVKGVLGRDVAGRTPASSAELAEIILEEAEVAVVPGEAFGPSGYLRLSYALGDDDLVEGVTRIARLLG